MSLFSSFDRAASASSVRRFATEVDTRPRILSRVIEPPYPCLRRTAVAGLDRQDLTSRPVGMADDTRSRVGVLGDDPGIGRRVVAADLEGRARRLGDSAKGDHLGSGPHGTGPVPSCRSTNRRNRCPLVSRWVVSSTRVEELAGVLSAPHDHLRARPHGTSMRSL